MNLITPLVSGITGAALGHVELYQRGTATRANWFQDFEGSLQISTGANITLDSNGGAQVYVNELVQVIVKDTAGVTVRDFVAGDAAGAIEYQGQSFTGTDYRTAAIAAGKPTNLQEILDLWFTQNLAIDWKVKVGATTGTIPSFLSALSGLFFNVKDAAYGALGDGVKDDTAAIQAALTAADNVGGIVFFPHGQYRVTSQLTMGVGANILGVGPANVFITMDHASNSLLAVTGGGVLESQFIENVSLSAAQANTGTLLSIGSSSRLLVRNVEIGLSTTSTGAQLVSIASNASVTRTVFEDCRFIPGGSSTQAVAMVNVAAGVTLHRCRFDAPASYSPTNGMVYGSNMAIIECQFVNNAATAGTFTCFKANSTTCLGRIVDCDFSVGGGATVTAITLGTYSASSYFIEAGNSFGLTITPYQFLSNAANAAGIVKLISRESGAYELTSNATPLTIPLDQFANVIVHRTTSADQTLVTALPPNGGRFTLILRNQSGGNITTETFPTNMSPGLTPTINDTKEYSVHGICATVLEGGPVLKVLSTPYVP